MIRAAGALRNQRVLDAASAPWSPTELRAVLPVTLAQTADTEEDQPHLNVLAVCSPYSQLDWPPCFTSVKKVTCGFH